MSDYSKATNFTAKDSLPSGNTNKIVKGSEIDNEFIAISSAIASKADINSPTFTGIPAAPTATAGSNTTQLANTAFVKAAFDTLGTMSTQNANAVAITGGTVSGVTISSLAADLSVADGGTGASTLAANSVLLGNGTSALQTVAPSTTGNFLRSNGTTWVSQTFIPVTSVATGNGLQGGPITSTGTLSIAAPAFNTVGSYVMGGTSVGGGNLVDLASGSNYAAGTGTNQIISFAHTGDVTTGGAITATNNLSGTWKYMGAPVLGANSYGFAICCRVS
jgi:hypothetical protein